MPPRARAVLADRRLQVAGDVAIAGAILAGSLAELAGGAAEWGGPLAAELAVAVACSAPLVWRRSRPVPVALVVVGGSIASGLIVAPASGPFETFVGAVVAAYSLGVYAGRRAILATVGAIALAWACAFVAARAREPATYYGDWVPALLWIVLAIVVGRVIRRSAERSRELERLAAALAAERDARAAEAVTVERARIARELHDVVAHNVSVMGIHAGAARRMLGEERPDVRDSLAVIERTGRATIDEMRRMLGVLRDDGAGEGRAPQPGLPDLPALAEQVTAAGLAVDLRVLGAPREVPAGLGLCAYRIVQEALTNALKHAGGAATVVTVRYREDALELEVVDDGPAATAPPGAGRGLVGIRERVALFGGVVEAGAAPAGGWRLAARLPIGAT